MRSVTYGGACSLDGYLAGADGALDWLHWSNDARDIMAKFWPTIDTVLIGRKTWEAAAGQGGGNLAGVATYLFSRTLKRAPKGVTLVSEAAGAFVLDLKRRPGKGICVMGGGELAGALFAAGAIDEVGLNIHPVLLGSGVPVFRDPGLVTRLTLTESRVLDGGCVLASYRVLR